MEKPPILAEGRNCWRKRRADRASFLVDAATYFEALAAALEKAQSSILIVGWDIESRIELFPHRNGTGPSPRLGDFLNRVVARRRGLWAHVLVWDFALLFALEREPHLLFKTGWRRHRRVRFHMDGEHPLGASHHQKIVVVDDKIAFAGGIDLTKARWDTPEHLPEDPRRRDPLGLPYGPFHDVQMLVDGEAAQSLGDLARERWRLATGRDVPPPKASEADPWPAGVRPDLTAVDVAIARTEPEYKGREAVREVEQLYRDSIEASRKWVYMENQYLTSKAIEESLASSLRRTQGPEVVIVLPKKCTGWLQEHVMGSLRSRVLRRLREADAYGRFRAYFPRTSPSSFRIVFGCPENLKAGVDEQPNAAGVCACALDLLHGSVNFINDQPGRHIGDQLLRETQGNVHFVRTCPLLPALCAESIQFDPLPVRSSHQRKRRLFPESTAPVDSAVFLPFGIRFAVVQLS